MMYSASGPISLQLHLFTVTLSLLYYSLSLSPTWPLAALQDSLHQPLQTDGFFALAKGRERRYRGGKGRLKSVSVREKRERHVLKKER